MNTTSWIKYVVIALVVVALIFGYNKFALWVPANEIVVVQKPVSGELVVYSQPGLQNQGFGDVVGTYPKFDLHTFDIPEDEKSRLNYDSAWVDNEVGMHGMKVTFNDNGTAIVFGSIPVEMPTDPASVALIQTKHGGFESFKTQIIKKQMQGVLSQLGALMTSREANAERRGDLVGYFEDMMRYGVYKTRTVSTREVDIITKDTVVVKYAEPLKDKDAPGGYARQAASELMKYNVVLGTPAINRIVFSNVVQNQLLAQQAMTMQIATSKAQALVAQQNAKTAYSNAEAKVQEVRADQMAIKEKAVIEAEQRRDVAQLDMKAAEFKKQQDILQGEGEAEKKRLLMNADGALNPKLEAWKFAQSEWAKAWGQNGAAITPAIVSGGGNGATGQNSAQMFMDLMGAKAAKDLGVDLNMRTK